MSMWYLCHSVADDFNYQESTDGDLVFPVLYFHVVGAPKTNDYGNYQELGPQAEVVYCCLLLPRIFNVWLFHIQLHRSHLWSVEA